ncbi:12250_t:CDS:2, partial [Racocetra fulgida]
MSASTSTSFPTILSNDDQNKLVKNKLNLVQPNDSLLTPPPVAFKQNLSFNGNQNTNLLDVSQSSHVDLAITPPLTPPSTSMNTPSKFPNNYYFEGFEEVLASYDSSPSSLNTSDDFINSNLTTPITDPSSLQSDDTQNNLKGEICVFTQVSTTIATVQQSPIPRLKFSKKRPSPNRFITSPHVKVNKSSDQSSSDNASASNLEIDPYPDSSISATTSDMEKDSSQIMKNSSPSDSMLFDGSLLTDYAMENPKHLAYDLFVKLWQRVNPTCGHSPSLSEGGSDYTTVTQTSRSISYNSTTYNSGTDSEPTKDSETEKFESSNSPPQNLSSKDVTDYLSVNDKNNISDNGNASESNSKKKILPNLSISIPKIPSRQQSFSSDEIMQPKETICKCLQQNDHSTFVVLDTKYSGSVESLYTLLFDSNFVPEFVQKLENNNDIELGVWSTDENVPIEKGAMSGQLCYFKSLDKALRKHISPKNNVFVDLPISKDDDSMTRQPSKSHSIRSKRIS